MFCARCWTAQMLTCGGDCRAFVQPVLLAACTVRAQYVLYGDKNRYCMRDLGAAAVWYVGSNANRAS